MVLPCSDRDATGRNSLCWELASHCTANSRSTPNSFCRNEDVRQQLCNFRATIAIREYASVDPAARQRATEMGSNRGGEPRGHGQEPFEACWRLPFRPVNPIAMWPGGRRIPPQGAPLPPRLQVRRSRPWATAKRLRPSRTCSVRAPRRSCAGCWLHRTCCCSWLDHQPSTGRPA